MLHLSLKAWIALAPIIWNFFWNAVYVLCPPREFFNSPRYNKFLDIVSYYGGLNLRSLSMLKLYGAPPSMAPPMPKQSDPPAK